jgi:hypothetical protein
MAILVSPGVDVQVIDESFYASAGQGTVPLIIMATAANKADPSGTTVAPYTAPMQAGKLFLATSQRELLYNFGNPKFYTVDGTPQHGHELNEYGLFAAYQYLGISNRCYVMRADIDTSQLEPSLSTPRGAPMPGTYWFDLSASRFGIFQSNGNRLPGAAWEAQTVRAVLSSHTVDMSGTMVPVSGFGNDGDFGVVVASPDNRVYEKISGAWVEVGSEDWYTSRPTIVRGTSNPPVLGADGSIMLNGVEVDFSTGFSLSDIVDAINNALNGASVTNLNAVINNSALVLTETSGGDINISNLSGTPLADVGITPQVYHGVQVYRTNTAQYPTGIPANSVWIKGSSANHGANWVVKYYNATAGAWMVMPAPFFPYDSTLSDGASTKDTAAFLGLGLPSTGNVYVGYDAAMGVQVLRRWSGTRWEDLVYEASFAEPSTEPDAGTHWFSNDLRVDVMVGNGSHWEGYRRRYPSTDPRGVQILGSQPVTQSDGSPLVENDLWLDSSDTENYPKLYRWDSTGLRWRRIDLSDQTTPFGVIFQDARANSGYSFEGIPNSGDYVFNSESHDDMLISDWVDPDAPDARLHPDGMLLFNTRYSTNNVKEWNPHYFEDGYFDPNTNFAQTPYTSGTSDYTFILDPADLGRWVTVSGNREDGSPYMGRKAQRRMIVKAMQSAVVANQDLRSELVYFNLMAAPGYPELIDEMVNLNTDQKEVSFIVGDTPCRLAPLANDIVAWSTNGNNVASNGETGLTTQNTYVGVYYPWGLSTDLTGNEVMIPPSAIALHTMAYNDQVAYPWFAPAGFQRGIVTNATTVGYLTSENEFKPVLLNPGQRDVLYLNKINPIAYIPGRGLVVFGQKTLSPLSSASGGTALDRVNVARLANYLKYNLDNLMKPFLFEQNDQQTRDAAALTVSKFLSNLVTLRGLSDYAVLCDETNNTPTRIDNNELWVDVLIRPLKAVEFIYIPVRIRPSGLSALTFTT